MPKPARVARRCLVGLAGLALMGSCSPAPDAQELPFAAEDSGSADQASGRSAAVTSTAPELLAPAPIDTSDSSIPPTTMADLADLVDAHDGALRVETFCDLSWTMPVRKRLLNSEGDPSALVEAFFEGTLGDLEDASIDAPAEISRDLDLAVELLTEYVVAAEAVDWDVLAVSRIPADTATIDATITRIEARAQQC